MREYAWYSPEYDFIVFQIIINDCYIAYEWGGADMYEIYLIYGPHVNPMQSTLWMPLGEL